MRKKNELLSTWGKHCKSQMILRDKSLTDVSTESGLGQTYVSAIINGRVIAPEATVRRISCVLGVDPALYQS